MITILPATEALVLSLDGRLRPGDAAECAAAGHSQREALGASFRRSLLAWVALEDGVVCAAWGVHAESTFAQVAQVWLLTGDGVDRNRKAFLRHTKAWTERVSEIFPVLMAAVHVEYVCAIRWLKWLGFDVSAPVALHNGALFHVVERGHV